MSDIDSSNSTVCFVEAEGDVVRITEPNSDAVHFTAMVNGSLFVVIICFFEVMRRKYPRIYGNELNRSKKRANHRSHEFRPLSDCKYPFSWVPMILSISDEAMKHNIGLDAYFYLRYISTCFWILFVSAIWALFVLFPLYSTASGQQKSIDRFSLSNVEKDDPLRVWAVVIYMYFFTMYVIYRIGKEYEYYSTIRMTFLAFGDINLDLQHFFSIKLESIPKPLRSNEALYAYFEMLFPGKVHSANLIMNVQDLNSLSVQRSRTLDLLEESVTKYNETKRRPYVGQSLIKCFTKCGKKFDAIDFYKGELQKLNDDFFTLKSRTFDLQREGRDSTSPDEWVQQNRLTLRSLDPSNSDITNRIDNLSEVSSEVIGYADNDHTIGNLQTDNGNENKTEEKNDERISDERILSRINRFKKNLRLLQTSERVSSSKLINSLSRVFGFDMIYIGFKDIKKNYYNMIERMDSTISMTGFVTFKDLKTATTAAAVPLCHLRYVFSIEKAPESRDIIWENIHYAEYLIQRKSKIASFIFAVLAILWAIPLIGIQAFSNWIGDIFPQKNPKWMSEDGYQTFRSFIIGYIPVLLLIGLIALLPIIFNAVGRNFERRKTQSSIEEYTIKRFFYYQLANIFVTTTSGSILEMVKCLLDHGLTAFFDLFGQTFPNFVRYFITFLMIKLFTSLPISLLRFQVLVPWVCKSRTPREVEDFYDNPKHSKFYYDREYPTQLLVMAICFTYSCISPTILVVGATYFGVGLVVYRYHLIYVCKPNYEAGAKFFPVVCNRTLAGLFFGQVMVIDYILLRNRSAFLLQGLALLPLPIWTLSKMNTLDRIFSKPAKTLTYERACDLDEDEILSARDTLLATDFSASNYVQPVLKQESILEPCSETMEIIWSLDVKDDGSRKVNAEETSS